MLDAFSIPDLPQSAAASSSSPNSFRQPVKAQQASAKSHPEYHIKSMRRQALRHTLLCASAIGSFAVPQLCRAQLPTSDLQEVYPPVAAAGSSVEVKVVGENLADLKRLRFDEPRIKAPPVLRPEDDFYPTRQTVDYHFHVDVPATVTPGIYEVRSLGHFGLSTARPFLVVAKDAIEVLEEGDHSTRETAAALAVETGITGKLDSRKADWYKISAKKGERLISQVLR